MRKYIKILFTLSCLLSTISLQAQGGAENVELLIMDDTNAIFSSEGSGSDKKEALENSKIAVLKKILYDGVQDFNDGYPIVKSGIGTNTWLRDLFDIGKNAPYRGFLGAVELVGDFDTTPTGNSHCRTNVIVNHKMLLQYAEAQGVTKEAGTLQIQGKTTKPQQKKQEKKYLVV